MTLRAKLARRVAIRRLDLDDICTKIAKLLCRIRTEHDGRAIENSYTGQGSGQIALHAGSGPALISGGGVVCSSSSGRRRMLALDDA